MCLTHKRAQIVEPKRPWRDWRGRYYLSVNGTEKIAIAKGLTEILWPTEIITAKVSILGLE